MLRSHGSLGKGGPIYVYLASHPTAVLPPGLGVGAPLPGGRPGFTRARGPEGTRSRVQALWLRRVTRVCFAKGSAPGSRSPLWANTRPLTSSIVPCGTLGSMRAEAPRLPKVYIDTGLGGGSPGRIELRRAAHHSEPRGLRPHFGGLHYSPVLDMARPTRMSIASPLRWLSHGPYGPVTASPRL